MRRHITTVPIALALTAALPFIQTSLYTQRQDSSQVHAFALGPGVDNLSLGDAFATYQWGLKNDGEFHLTQLQQDFSYAGDHLGGPPGQNQSGSVGIPKAVGPGAYDATVTNAVAGVDINILPAWNLYNKMDGKRTVIVAVIDTGIEYTHPELAHAMWINPGEIPGDGIDNDGNGYIDDIYGWDFYYGNNQTFVGLEDSHGTHAAGTISAGKGDLGVTGITDNKYVKLMSLKALGGSQGAGSVDDVVAAIHYAEANGASICNLSFGTDLYDAKLEQTIAASKMLFVVASGNGDSDGNGYNIDEVPVYPAGYTSDNIISVANLMFDGNLSPSSNYGVVGVDIAAPGSYVLSTVPENQYGFMSGTSMAAPMVTGVAAMVLSSRGDIGVGDVKRAIMESAKKMAGLDGKVLSGGMVDALGAMEAISS